MSFSSLDQGCWTIAHHHNKLLRHRERYSGSFVYSEKINPVSLNKQLKWMWVKEHFPPQLPFVSGLPVCQGYQSASAQPSQSWGSHIPQGSLLTSCMCWSRDTKLSVNRNPERKLISSSFPKKRCYEGGKTLLVRLQIHWERPATSVLTRPKEISGPKFLFIQSTNIYGAPTLCQFLFWAPK